MAVKISPLLMSWSRASCSAMSDLLEIFLSLALQAVKNQSQSEIVDEEAMSQIRKGHETMCVVLTSRHKNLDTVRAVWSTGDIKARKWGLFRVRDKSNFLGYKTRRTV